MQRIKIPGFILVDGNNPTFTGGSFHGKVSYGNTQKMTNLPDSDTLIKATPPFSFADTRAKLMRLLVDLAAKPANGQTTIQRHSVSFIGDATNNV